MDLVTMGLSTGTLQLFAGVLLIAVGFRCLPQDMRRPWGGGTTGAPLDVALIVIGVVMVVTA